MAARQTDAKQAAMAARQIGGASRGCEPVSEAARTPQGSVCCGPFFAIRTPQASVCCGRVRLLRPRAGIWRFFAPGLIAAKPVKPCDRAVFGAFYWLLFLQRNGRWLRGGLAAHRRGASRFPQPSARRKAALAANRFFAHSPQASVCCERVRLLCPRAEIWRFFAPGLIAAKPVKPCDRAVFGAFFCSCFCSETDDGRAANGR